MGDAHSTSCLVSWLRCTAYLGMRETEIARKPSRLWNPHFYAIFVQVHNTL
jgi:hypothetical protein